MNNEQLLAEIREANLTYLMLAQNLIRADRAEALFRLGLSEDAADLIVNLSPSQVLKVAQGNMLLCRMRVDDDLVWNLLTNHGLQAPSSRAGNEAANKLHASILMASRYAEAL
jgi:flagellar transcriptional activator FlhD